MSSAAVSTQYLLDGLLRLNVSHTQKVQKNNHNISIMAHKGVINLEGRKMLLFTDGGFVVFSSP